MDVCAKSLQLCLTLCNPMNYSLPGSSVHGILQARTLKNFLLRGIFPIQGLDLCLLCLLQWGVGSLPLAPPGKPSNKSPNNVDPEAREVKGSPLPHLLFISHERSSRIKAGPMDMAPMNMILFRNRVLVDAVKLR